MVEFDDLEEGLKEGVISEKTCRLIHTWNKEVGRENWDMDDVMYALYPALGRHMSRNFLYSNIKNLVDLEVMECVNPDTEHGRLAISYSKTTSKPLHIYESKSPPRKVIKTILKHYNNFNNYKNGKVYPI